MKAIKFRGKSLVSGEWIFGWLLQREIDSSRLWIRVMNPLNQPPRYTDYSVDPGTVGQFTGMTDRNGVEIYEGDIIECDILEYDDLTKGKRITVKFDHGGFYPFTEIYGATSGMLYTSKLYLETVCIVGNIYQNPELVTTDK